MKKNDKKYLRIGFFAVVFLLGLFVSIIEKNGWIALIACVGVPLLYIPYGISDWKRRKQVTISGMLLYAKTDEQIVPDNTYQMSGNQISVKTLDLNCGFDEIRDQLDKLTQILYNRRN